MRAIVLTCNTGQGHNSAGRAIRLELNSHDVECETADALSFLGERVSGVIAGTFVNIAVKTPNIFGLMYQAGEKLSKELPEKIKSPVYRANTLYAENLYRYLEENQIDAAICPHLFPAEALTYIKRKKKLKTKCYFISTDYTCIPFLEETDMDVVFIPHRDLRREFITRGVPGECIVDTGVPVLSKFSGATPKNIARSMLGIPQNIPAFLVMTGGEGCGNAQDLTEEILNRIEEDTRVVVMPGRNTQLKNELLFRFGDDKRVMVIGFTDSVELYMDACDVLLTKPGGISSTEAAVKGIPMIHTSPIPGCETINARFFSERGMSILAPDEESAAESAIRLSKDGSQKRRMLEAQAQYINKAAAEDICKRIIQDATNI